MKKKSYNFLIVLTIIIFLAGAGFFLYPYISNWYLTNRANKEIKTYNSEINALSVSGVNPELKRLYNDAYKYNEKIYKNGQSDLKDQYSYQESLFNLNDYSLKSNVFGYIYIPKINVKLPIYLGATQNNMSLGAVHLTYTSIPIDQNNTNTVIAAHRGWAGAPYFRYINRLSLGDDIILRNPWGTLSYKVSAKKIIEKDDISEIFIKPGKKMLTLSTCHPYRINTHRYLIYAELVKSDQKVN